MLGFVVIASLIAYSVVVSQPLAYILFLGRAQRALSGPAYIELRQHINPVMSRRLPATYVATIAILLLLLVLSMHGAKWKLLIAATVALFCLVIDIVFMTRENVPINGVIDGWSTTDYPENWEDYRRKWFAVFGYRQVVLLS